MPADCTTCCNRADSRHLMPVLFTTELARQLRDLQILKVITAGSSPLSFWAQNWAAWVVCHGWDWVGRMEWDQWTQVVQTKPGEQNGHSIACHGVAQHLTLTIIPQYHSLSSKLVFPHPHFCSHCHLFVHHYLMLMHHTMCIVAMCQPTSESLGPSLLAGIPQLRFLLPELLLPLRSHCGWMGWCQSFKRWCIWDQVLGHEGEHVHIQSRSSLCSLPVQFLTPSGPTLCLSISSRHWIQQHWDLVGDVLYGLDNRGQGSCGCEHTWESPECNVSYVCQQEGVDIDHWL